MPAPCGLITRLAKWHATTEVAINQRGATDVAIFLGATYAVCERIRPFAIMYRTMSHEVTDTAIS